MRSGAKRVDNLRPIGEQCLFLYQSPYRSTAERKDGDRASHSATSSRHETRRYTEADSDIVPRRNMHVHRRTHVHIRTVRYIQRPTTRDDVIITRPLREHQVIGQSRKHHLIAWIHNWRESAQSRSRIWVRDLYNVALWTPKRSLNWISS